MKSTLLSFLFLLLSYGIHAQCDCTFNPNDVPVCVQDSSGGYFQLPNACFAQCFGLAIVADSLCQGGGPGGGCDCQLNPNEPFICAQDSIGNYVEVPNACFALCFGLTVVDDSLCIGGGWPGDCGCSYDPEEPFICAQDSIGNYLEVPNACFAQCYGLTVVNDTLCNGGWTVDCDCEINPDEPFVCVQDSTGYYFQVPNACYAQCFGFTIVSDSLCTNGGGWPGGDCDCEINPNEPFICVQDSTGITFQVPNQCFADCYGLTVVNDSLCVVWDPWSDCDCEIDLEAPFVCAVDSLGHPCYVPNECFATCLGLTIVSDTLCSLDSLEIYEDDFISCLDSIGNYNTFQEFILAANDICDMEVPECILNAPLFNNDSLFFEYILNNCNEITSGGNVMNIYNSFNNNKLLSTKQPKINKFDIQLLQNPVFNQLEFNINMKQAATVNTRITDINGQIKIARTLHLHSGVNKISTDVSGLNSGLYLISIHDKDGITTLKFVKQ